MKSEFPQLLHRQLRNVGTLIATDDDHKWAQVGREGSRKLAIAAHRMRKSGPRAIAAKANGREAAAYVSQ